MLHSSPLDNPLEIAKPFAEGVGTRTQFGQPEDEDVLLAQLDDLIDLGQVEGKYFVETHRALSIPAVFDKDKSVNYISFYGLSFEGPFRSFSIVQVGRIIGAHSVRALCLTFSEATLLPYLEDIPDDHILHVPVLAVEDISRTN